MLKKAIYILLISFSFTQTVQAQFERIDEAWTWFENTNSEIDSKSTENLLEEKEEALQSAIDLKRQFMESRLSKELAFLHITKTYNHEKAMSLLIRSLEIDEQENQKIALLFTYIGFYQLFSQVEDYFYAKDFLEKASDILRHYQQAELRIYINQNLGQTYRATSDIGKALEEHQNILDYAKAERAPALEAESHMDIAQIYVDQNLFDNALEHYKSALTIFRRMASPIAEGRCLLAIGDIHQVQNKDQQAYENYIAALDVTRTAKENTHTRTAIYNSVGNYYLQQNNSSQALANLKLAYPLAQETQDQNLIQQNYRLLSKAYKAEGNFKLALEYSELSKALDDFLQKEKNDRSILKMQSRYSLNQKQGLIDQLEFNRIQKDFELEEQRKFKNFLGILAGLIAVILILILTLFLQSRKSNSKLKQANLRVQLQNEELENLNSTKDKFFSIISHDLKGPLNSLTSFSGLLMNHTSSLSTEEIQMLAKDLDKSLKNLFALLENLLQWSRSQTGNIDFTKETFNITEVLQENRKILLQQAENKNIDVEVKNTKPLEVIAHQNSITTVIRNLLSNAIKFTKEGGQIKLGVVEEGGFYVVKIADNGVGMPKDIAQKIFRIDTKHSTPGTSKEKGTGLGLILCKEFIEKNGGEIWVKSEEGKGSIFAFSIPKEA